MLAADRQVRLPYYSPCELSVAGHTAPSETVIALCDSDLRNASLSSRRTRRLRTGYCEPGCLFIDGLPQMRCLNLVTWARPRVLNVTSRHIDIWGDRSASPNIPQTQTSLAATRSGHKVLYPGTQCRGFPSSLLFTVTLNTARAVTVCSISAAPEYS